MSRFPRIFCNGLILALYFLGGCKKMEVVKSELDELSFSWTGGTIFGEPFKVTTKQLHFDTGDLFGREVILEGDIVERGESSTFLTLSDQDGRMLVVLTEVDDAYKFMSETKSSHVKVLGRLERGKKGLPYLLAKAITGETKSSQ